MRGKKLGDCWIRLGNGSQAAHYKKSFFLRKVYPLILHSSASIIKNPLIFVYYNRSPRCVRIMIAEAAFASFG